ncbi:MAG: biotin/lipoyl-containing protein, partial [Bacteroidota bacterium]
MALVELLMPKMGESIMEATVLTWLKSEGDTIEEDESILEVATDKVDTEVPTTHAGVLKEILAKDGDVVEVGKPIAIIATEGDDDGSSEAPVLEEVTTDAGSSASAEASSAAHSNGAVRLETPASGRFYSPLVKNIAKEEGISIAELDTVPGTGKEGRVTKKDILAYLENRGSAPIAVAQETVVAPTNSTQLVTTERPVQRANVSISAGDEIIEMDRMRKMIAERMVDSKRISPHVTSF